MSFPVRVLILMKGQVKTVTWTQEQTIIYILRTYCSEVLLSDSLTQSPGVVDHLLEICSTFRKPHLTVLTHTKIDTDLYTQ